MEHTFEIIGFTTPSMAHLEAMGLSKCLKAYAENASGEEILWMGFNCNSGYTFIIMEHVHICSMLGRDVEYLVLDYEGDGDFANEIFFNTYQEAINNTTK
jgi:hypothetical protein